MNRIYVTGHRNPDTDSIAAAISYAALRNALGNRDYVAAHLGHISDETKRLLDRFGFQEPVTISNVRTQVRDLDFDTPPALNSSVTMDRAWHIMRDQDISAMPIINEDGTLYGMLSAGDIAAYSMRTISDRHVDALPLFNLLSVIEGRILNDGAEQVDRVSGVVTIALPQSCDNLLFSDPDSIILCGNQPDMIRRALDIGVQCIILCQTDVDPAWLENAGKTCVIVDDLIDTAGTLCNAAAALVEKGRAKKVIACATHGVLSGPAIERLEKSVIDELVILDTVPLNDRTRHPMIKTISVAPVFAEAIERIYEDKPVSPLFV